MASTPTDTTSTPADAAPPTIIYRAITLRVDLRVLAAIGGALIIIGALLPWITPAFEPFQRALRPTTTGSWPVVAIGAIAILILFFSRFRTPRVSTGVAALGLVAGLLALSSALNTLAVRDVMIGNQSISTLSGIGLGVYLTLAGSIITILAGLAPQPIGSDVARAEIRLWQPSFAIFGSAFVLFVLGAIGLGVWLGGSGVGGRTATATPAVFDAGLFSTPLINSQVNPLMTLEHATPIATQPAPVAAPSITPPPKPTEPLIAVPSPTTTLAPSRFPTDVPRPTYTFTPTPTQPTSPIPTSSRTPTPTPTSTSTSTSTPTATPTPTATATVTPTS